MTSTLSRLFEHGPAERTASARHTARPVDVEFLPIAANLLPREAGDARRQRGGRIIALTLVAVAVLAVGGWLFSAQHETSAAASQLSAAQDRQHSLEQQQGQYAGLLTTQELTRRLQAQLRTLMASDIPWGQTMPDRLAVPGVVTITSATTSLTPTGTTPTATAGTVPADPGAIGTVVIGGSAVDKAAVAALVDTLAAQTGFSNPFVTSVDEQQDTHLFQFTIQVDITQAIRGTAAGRWTGTAGGGR